MLRTLIIASLFYALLSGVAASPSNQYAKNFEIEEKSDHRLVTVSNPWRGSADTRFTYALVPRGNALPENLPDQALIIRTPAKRLITFSTIYFGFIKELDLYDQLVGAAFTDYANDPLINERVESGNTKVVQAGAALDIESILLLEADLILDSRTDESQYDAHPKLQRANQPIVLTASYMEEHPLARAEWIKFVAAFFDKGPEAERIFAKVADRYEALTEIAKATQTRPTVFTNTPFAGQWRIPGGKSFTTTLIADAGASYLWDDDKTSGGIPLDFERVFHRAVNADFWLHQSSFDSLSSLLALDERFMNFQAFRNKKVFNNNKRTNANGGNDVWERGVMHPEEVLADLIRIFHPNLQPDHELIYYKQLE